MLKLWCASHTQPLKLASYCITTDLILLIQKRNQTLSTNALFMSLIAVALNHLARSSSRYAFQDR